MEVRMRFSLSPSFRPARVSFLACLTALIALVGCTGDGGGAAPTAGNISRSTPPYGLVPATSVVMAAHFRRARAEASGPDQPMAVWIRDGMVALASSAAGPATTSAAAFSGTTLQEDGVDEEDLVKTDGADLYDVVPASGQLRRQRLETGSAPRSLASLDLAWQDGVATSGLYLDPYRSTVAVLATTGASGGTFGAWFRPSQWQRGATELLVAGTDGDGLAQRHRVRIDAHLLGSRRIGQYLYLVLRSHPDAAALGQLETATEATTAAAVQAVLPTISIDAEPAQPLVQVSGCLLQTDNAAVTADVMTVVAIDLASPVLARSARCFTGGTEAFYLSPQSLYLATTRSPYQTEASGLPVYDPQARTDIHQFALNGLDVAYRASGSVVGHLGFDQNRKSFRMGEHAGVLRVATETAVSMPMVRVAVDPVPCLAPVSFDPVTGQTTPGICPNATSTITEALVPSTEPTVGDSPVRLAILRPEGGQLEEVGSLPNARRPAPLGKPGEKLYASRFLGDRGYLVTFRLTDPLYVLDLSDPTDPRIAGELHVDGYSDYLFPVGRDLLLGVGKEAASDGSAGDGRFAWYQGVKVSLIDVADPAQPTEVAREILGRRGTDATVLRDHHGIALMVRDGVVRAALPLRLHETTGPWMTGSVSDYYDFTRVELQRFEVNVQARTLTRLSALPSSTPQDRDIQNDRAVLWNDQVHWYQAGDWTWAPW